MDLSALQRAVGVLEASLDSMEFWLFLSTLAVVVGLLVEYWFPFRKLIKAFRERPPFPWKLILEMVGGILVTIGVAGELLFQFRASRVETTLRSDSHQIESLLNKQASDAQGEAATARKEAEGFQSQIAGSNARARGAEAVAEQERLEQAQLELLVSPRRLTLNQQRRIGDACLGISGKPVTVSSYGLDGEGFALGVQILYALHRSGLNVRGDMGGVISTGAFDTGVLVSAPPEEDQFARCLADALHTIGGLDVLLNGERHTGSVSMRGGSLLGGSIIGGSTVRRKGPLPSGSPIEIFVGVKPVQIEIAK